MWQSLVSRKMLRCSDRMDLERCQYDPIHRVLSSYMMQDPLVALVRLNPAQEDISEDVPRAMGLLNRSHTVSAASFVLPKVILCLRRVARRHV